jgi:DNA-binding transcriptional LysR family regulator
VELRQLAYFAAVVRCGGFTRAAEELHVAQPAISTQVRRLERELGVELLHRSTRSVALTTAGGKVLAHAQTALAHVELVRAEAAAHRDVERGHVRVGATAVTGGLDVVEALRRFRGRHPRVTLSLRTGLVTPLLADLRRHELDVVVAPWHGEDDPDVEVTRVGDERLVLVTSATDARTIESLADVADDAFVCLPAGSGLRRLLDDAFAAVGRAPRVDFETQTPASIRELVAAGLGTALVAESTTAGPGPALAVHHVDGLPEHPPICVFTPSGSGSAAARRFVAELTDR